MTNDGNFNIERINTVEIPSISRGISTPTFGAHYSGFFSRPTFYYDDTYVYTVSALSWYVNRSLRHDIANGVPFRNSQPAGQTNFPSTIYPAAIGDYFYSFGTIDDLGGSQSGRIFRAHKDTPMSWYNTGITATGDASYPMIYVDATNYYIIGGINSFTPINNIDYAAIASPLSLTNAPAPLPAARAGGAIQVVGSTIYMYGGYDATSTEVDTIYSAPTSNPLLWTDTGAFLPAAIASAAPYANGTHVYLFGGLVASAGVNTIYRADIGTPTAFTAVGTLPVTGYGLALFVDGDYMYVFQYPGLIYKSLLSDLLTWTAVHEWHTALNTAVSSTHLYKDNATDTIYAFGGFTAVATMSTAIQTTTTTNPLEWSTSGTVLPAALGGGQLVQINDYLYIIGGNQATGNYYRASVTDPLTWELVDATGPARTRGRAIIHNGHLYYLGGETGGGTMVASASVTKGVIGTDGTILEWLSAGPPYFPMTLPVALSRFCLVVAGDYVYIVGGMLTSTVANTIIYRTSLDTLSGGAAGVSWINVGTLGSSSLMDATVLLIDNYCYIVGGGTSTATSDDYVLSANMTDLSNGVALFTEENTALVAGGCAEASAFMANEDVYLVGLRGVSPTQYVYRSLNKKTHNLIVPKVPESTESIPTIDGKSGALGSYTSFQRTSMYPWMKTEI